MTLLKRRRLWTVSVTALLIAGVTGLSQGWFKPTETVITQVAPGVYFRKVETEPKFIGSNQGWVVFKDFVLVIDASFPNQAEKLIPLIRETTDKPIRYVFDTHYHGDHADGNPALIRAGATAIASENSRQLFDTKGLAGFQKSQKDNPDEYGKYDYDRPALYFPQKLVIDDGEQRVELLHFGHAHTAGDAFAWLPKHGIVFTGDACVNGAFNYTGDSNTESWIGVLTQVAGLAVKRVCPGHGEMSDISLVETQKRYFVELRMAVQRLIDDGRTLEQIKTEVNVPFYTDWTGVDVKTRVENIEHVYGELTGRKAR